MRLEAVIATLDRLIPPISELLIVIHSMIHEDPARRRELSDEIIRDLGLLQRVWFTDKKQLDFIEKCARYIAGLSIEDLVKTFFMLLREYIQTRNSDAIRDLLFLIEGFLRGGQVVHSIGIIPRKEVMLQIDRASKLDLLVLLDEVKSILGKITKANSFVAPFQRLDLAIRLLYGRGLSDINDGIIQHFFSSRDRRSINILEGIVLSVFVATCSIKEPLKLLIIEEIFNQLVESNEQSYPISVLFDILEFICDSNVGLLLDAIYLQRIAEIHGGWSFYLLARQLISSSILPKIVKLATLVNSYRGFSSKRIIALSIRRGKYRLRRINDVLYELRLKPRGIALVIPWELQGGVLAIRKYVTKVCKYFKDAHVRPPQRLLLLKKFLSSLAKAEKFVNLTPKKIEDLIDPIACFMESRSLANVFSSKVKRLFGDTPALIRVMKRINNVYDKLSKRWEYLLLNSYNELTKLRLDIFTSSALMDVFYNGSPKGVVNVALIIDGLRYDDFILGLVPKLIRTGLKPVKLGPKISLLPSITIISRTSIMLGEAVRSLVFSKQYRQREEDIIKAKYGDVEYYYGPIGMMINRFRRQSIHSDKIFFILSELEKSMHGATESIMVHFVEEYLDSIVELIMCIMTELSKQYNFLRLVICSDHGLGVFLRHVPIEDYVEDLKRKGYIDVGVEPIIRERYAIIPLKDESLSMGARQIYTNNDEYREGFWITTGGKLGLKEIEFRRKGTEVLTRIKSGDSVIVAFPKGNRKFLPGRGAVYHGGLSPEETFSAFGIFEFSLS